MRWIRGYYRICLSGLILGLGGTMVTFASYLPLEIRGYRVSFWILVMTVRSLLRVLNVRINCPDKPSFRAHQGFIFPNHVSFADALVMAAVTPVRFLAKAEIRSWPVIGMIAKAIGCVFVKREDKKSRSEARSALAKVATFPPIALFPEGKRGPGDELLPFRYGAFEIAIGGQSALLPCAIIYDPLDMIIWRRGENLLSAVWRTACFAGPITADVLALDVVQTNSDSDPVTMSIETREQIAAALRQSHAEEDPAELAASQ